MSTAGKTPAGSGGGPSSVSIWRHAAQSFELLGMVASLRDALCTSLGLPKGASSISSPPLQRVGSPCGSNCTAVASTAPTPKEIRKLRDVCTAFHRALGGLLQNLDDGPSPACAAEAPAGANQEQQFRNARENREAVQMLEHTARELQARVSDLEEPVARVADLEVVVSQLQNRVLELEAEEARISSLRDECGRLRSRIAELVAMCIPLEDLEQQRLDLQEQVSKFEVAGMSQGGAWKDTAGGYVTSFPPGGPGCVPMLDVAQLPGSPPPARPVRNRPSGSPRKVATRVSPPKVPQLQLASPQGITDMDSNECSGRSANWRHPPLFLHLSQPAPGTGHSAGKLGS